MQSIGVQWGMADSGPVNTLKGLAGGIPLWLSETKCGGSIRIDRARAQRLQLRP